MFSKKSRSADSRGKAEHHRAKRSPGRKLKRFLATMLVGGSIALAAGCGKSPGSEQADAATQPDAALVDAAPVCSNPPGHELVCGGNVIAGVLDAGEKFTFSPTMTLLFEDIETHNDEPNAIIAIQDNDCNPLKRDLMGVATTKTFVLEDEAYDVTVFAMGEESGSKWVDLRIAPSGCEDLCLPDPECGVSAETFIVTLGEGESETEAGLTLLLNEVMEDVGAAPDGDPCPVSNERVTVTIHYPDGRTVSLEMSEDQPVCERSADGCYTVKLEEVMEDVGVASGGTCPVSNERARFRITVGGTQ